METRNWFLQDRGVTLACALIAMTIDVLSLWALIGGGAQSAKFKSLWWIVAMIFDINLERFWSSRLALFVKTENKSFMKMVDLLTCYLKWWPLLFDRSLWTTYCLIMHMLPNFSQFCLGVSMDAVLHVFLAACSQTTWVFWHKLHSFAAYTKLQLKCITFF